MKFAKRSQFHEIRVCNLRPCNYFALQPPGQNEPISNPLSPRFRGMLA